MFISRMLEGKERIDEEQKELVREAIKEAFGAAARMSELSNRQALNTAEAAELYGFSKSTLEIWRSQGRGPKFYKEGKIVLYRQRELQAYLEGGLVRTADQL